MTSNVTEFNSRAPTMEFAPNVTVGIRDTGTVMRAFLPFKNTTERSRLLEYQAFGTVIDARVICMKSNLTNVVYYSGFRLSGIADVALAPHGLVKDNRISPNNATSSFDCGFGEKMESATCRNFWMAASFVPARVAQPRIWYVVDMIGPRASETSTSSMTLPKTLKQPAAPPARYVLCHEFRRSGDSRPHLHDDQRNRD